jgi:hypothetical protein
MGSAALSLTRTRFNPRPGSGQARQKKSSGAGSGRTAWTYVYVRWRLSHDEFERTLELQSVALGAGLMILGGTILGLFKLLLEGPRVPIAFIAPAFSALYAIVRMLISRSYR